MILSFAIYVKNMLIYSMLINVTRTASENYSYPIL